MRRIYLYYLLVLTLLLFACQPQVVTVEVTPAGGSLEAPTPVMATAVSDTAPTPSPIVQEVTRIVPQPVTVEVTKAPLGTAARPVQLLFSPQVETTVIATRAAPLADALSAVTGYEFTAGIVDSEQALIELMCAAPTDVIGFLSAAAYVLAHEQCGAQVAAVAQNSDGLTWQTGMLVTRRDGGLNNLEDLAGRRWAVPDDGGATVSKAFEALLADAGVEPAEIITVPGESAAMLAVYNGDVDFATASYVPPIMPFEERLWEYGADAPEVWRRTGLAPTRSPIGYVLVNGEPEFGGYRLRDARSRVFDVEPGIYNETQIVALSGQFPNDTIAFGRDFPLALARDVTAVLLQFVASETCEVSLCAADFYGWTGLQAAEDERYAPIRFVRDRLNLTPDDLLAWIN